MSEQCKLLPLCIRETNNVRGESEGFGEYVGISGDGSIVSVGSPSYDDNRNSIDENHGRLYFLSLNASRTGFVEVADPIVGEQINFEINVHDMAADGLTVVTTADTRAFVYTRAAGSRTWTKKGKDVPNVERANQRSDNNFPTAVLSGDGNTLAVLTDDTESLKIFEYSATAMDWVEAYAGPKADEDQFGQILQISDDGNTVMVNGYLTNPGRVPEIYDNIPQIIHKIGGVWQDPILPSNADMLREWCPRFDRVTGGRNCKYDMSANGQFFTVSGITLNNTDDSRGVAFLEYDQASGSVTQVGDMLQFIANSLDRVRGATAFIADTGTRAIQLRDADELFRKYIDVFDLVNNTWVVQSRDDSGSENFVAALSNDGTEMVFGISFEINDRGEVVMYSCQDEAADKTYKIAPKPSFSRKASEQCTVGKTAKGITDYVPPGGNDAAVGMYGAGLLPTVLLCLMALRAVFR